ncbi:MAG: hypothetical protein MR698_03355 [Selenomonas sp.]|nr:hypothetical protein [Selenomonas sp.]
MKTPKFNPLRKIAARRLDPTAPSSVRELDVSPYVNRATRRHIERVESQQGKKKRRRK